MKTSRSIDGFVRWLKFSLVGIIGVGVQLAVVFALTSVAHLNYLIGTLIAVEAAVAHNFFWHQRFTWSDRGRTQMVETLGRLVRFNAGNGAISLVGNVLLMRILVGHVHLRVVPANLISIAVCALTNFIVSDRWVFLPISRGTEQNSSLSPSTTRSGGRSTRLFVAHQQQRALGKRNIDQSGAGGECQADANLRHQKKRCERPELVQRENEYEYLSKFRNQGFNFECHGGQQVEAHSDADQG